MRQKPSRFSGENTERGGIWRDALPRPAGRVRGVGFLWWIPVSDGLRWNRRC
jgi:hypothetical protein